VEDLLVGDAQHGEQPYRPAQLPQHPARERAHRQPGEVRARDEYVDHRAVAAVEEVLHSTATMTYYIYNVFGTYPIKPKLTLVKRYGQQCYRLILTVKYSQPNLCSTLNFTS
jgi:hypothetical protein